MQRSLELNGAKKSWLAQKVAKNRIAPLLHLLPVKDEMLELSATMSKASLTKSLGGLQKDVLALHGVPLDTLRMEFAAVEQYFHDPRASVASSSGSSLLAPSISSQASARSSLSTVLSQYSNDDSTPQRYFCPSCFASFGRSNDMASHMRKKCEDDNLTHYQCHDCGHVEHIKSKIEEHSDTHSAPGRPTLGFAPFEMPAKRSFGCPYCEKSSAKLSKFHEHLIQQHFKNGTNERGSSSLRVRAGIRAAGLVDLVEEACRRRHLLESSWRLFEWDDANAAFLWDKLEYGIMDPEIDPFSYKGVNDIPNFITWLFDKRLHEDGVDEEPRVHSQAIDPLIPSELTVPPPLSVNDVSEPLPALYSQPQLAAPAPAHHRRVEHLRSSRRLPVRSMSTQQSSSPASVSRSEANSSVAPLSGHKHKVSADSALHPDGTDRSRNSPVPPGNAHWPLREPSAAWPLQEQADPLPFDYYPDYPDYYDYADPPTGETSFPAQWPASPGSHFDWS